MYTLMHYYAQDPGVNASTNFRWNEFACSCCGQILVAERLVDMCQAVRSHLSKPLVESSAYRCPLHNRAERGADRSLHTMGLAVDLSLPEGSEDRVWAHQFLASYWQGRVLRYSWGLHVDCSDPS